LACPRIDRDRQRPLILTFETLVPMSEQGLLSGTP